MIENLIALAIGLLVVAGYYVYRDFAERADVRRALRMEKRFKDAGL